MYIKCIIDIKNDITNQRTADKSQNEVPTHPNKNDCYQEEIKKNTYKLLEGM